MARARVIGLYESQGVLRFAGRNQDDCLAYAELFDLDPSHYGLSPLVPVWPEELSSGPG